MKIYCKGDPFDHQFKNKTKRLKCSLLSVAAWRGCKEMLTAYFKNSDWKRIQSVDYAVVKTIVTIDLA